MAVENEPNSTLPTYSRLMKEARSESKKSVRELSELVGVAETTWRNAEVGRGTPGVFTHIELAFPERANEIKAAWEEFRESQSKGSGADRSMFIQKRSRRRLDGVWYALWQTTTDGVEILNTEILKAAWGHRGVLVISNEAPSEENPIGGYLLSANLELHDNSYMMGTYVPLDETTQSRGTMFGVLHRSGKSVRGIWAGCNYDSDLTSGKFVLSRSSENLRKLMAELAEIDVDQSPKK